MGAKPWHKPSSSPVHGIFITKHTVQHNKAKPLFGELFCLFNAHIGREEAAAESHFIYTACPPPSHTNFINRYALTSEHASSAGSKAIESYLSDLYILLCFGRVEGRCEERALLKVMKRHGNKVRRRKMMVLYQKAIYLSWENARDRWLLKKVTLKYDEASLLSVPWHGKTKRGNSQNHFVVPL